MGRLATSGDIGVRCAKDRRVLWFHVPGGLATPVVTHWPFMVEYLPTPKGIKLKTAVARLGAVRSVTVYNDQFGVYVRHPEAWPAVLPQVVTITRQLLFNGRDAQVYLEPGDAGVSNWHEMLLRRLYA